MKKFILSLVFSTFAIFTMSCDAETLAALTGALFTEGCTISENPNFNPAANKHNADSCATVVPGCTNSSALNYMADATEDDGSCNLGASGCMDPYLTHYDATATISDPTACGAPLTTAGCTDATACNYNIYATADCSNNTGITDQTCCQAMYVAADTTIACYLDLNDNGYYEQMQNLTTNNCGCEGITGYGWSDQTNGQELAGCMDPTCPEYSPSYNMNNNECCITDFSEFGLDSTFLQTDQFNIMGGYEMVMGSDCGNQDPSSSGDTETGFIFLGWDMVDNTGIYFTEMERTHVVTGSPAEPAWDWNATNQNACEAAAGPNAPWWCENDMAGGWDQNFTPCQDAYFDQECWNNPECIWLYAECTEKPNTIHDACYQSTTQPTCESKPGCWWENGYDDMGGWQFSDPYCYFDCPNLDSAECQSLPTECSWNLGGSSGWSYCGYTPPAGVAATPATCNVANQLLGAQSTGDCWWQPDDWNNFQGTGHCECGPWQWTTTWDAACDALGNEFTVITATEPDYCDWAPQTNACTAADHQTSTTCWNDWDNYCYWEESWDSTTQTYKGECVQEPWFNDSASCWDQNMQFASTCTADANCEWFDPGVNAGTPTWAQDGLCENFDPCHYNEHSNAWGHQNQQDCNQDQNCNWEQGQGGQPGGCYENAYEQWCDCRYEYTSTTCASGMVWEAFDNWNGQCMNPIDQWSCEYGYTGGPGDGYIDCTQYEDVDRFQEWNVATSTCTEIKSEFEEGEWYLDGNSLCHTAEEEINCATISQFEKCECARECHWNGQGDPQQDPWTWEQTGTCSGNEPGPGGSRAKAHINPRINGTNSIFEDVNPTVLEFLYSSSPDGFKCLPMTVQSNGDILLQDAGEGGCSVTLKRLELGDLGRTKDLSGI